MRPCLLTVFVSVVSLAGSSCAPPGGAGPAADCSNFRDLEEDVTEDRTLSAGSCFDVTSTIAVESDARLTVEEGVVLRFQPGNGLDVDGGTIEVVGTEETPTLLTGADKTAGTWAGIRIRNADDATNVVRHAIVEFAGSSRWGANLRVDDGNAASRLEIRNSSFRRSAGWGISSAQVANSLELATFSGNTVTGNAKTLKLPANEAGGVAEDNSLSGNERDIVDLAGPVTDDQTWRGLQIPYRISGNVAVGNGAHLTVEAGAQFDVSSDVQFEVTPDGTLAVEGADDRPVEFRGLESRAGYWNGIYFNSSAGEQNRIDHAILRHGGGGDAAGRGNLRIGDDQGATTIAITNSTFRASSAWGIHIEEDDHPPEITECSGNTFEENADGPINADDTPCNPSE